jgi:hypothetical protein
MRRRIRELIDSGTERNTVLRCTVECGDERHRIEWTPAQGVRFTGHPGGEAQLDADIALAILSESSVDGCALVLKVLRTREYEKTREIDPAVRKVFARIRGMSLARERQGR